MLPAIAKIIKVDNAVKIPRLRSIFSAIAFGKPKFY